MLAGRLSRPVAPALSLLRAAWGGCLLLPGGFGHDGHRSVSPNMIPRARETTCCILLTLFVSHLSSNQMHVCFRDRAIFCSIELAYGNPPHGATPSLMANRLYVESSDNMFLTVIFDFSVHFLFCLFGVNVLGARCSSFSQFSLFDFPGLCFKVENDTILFTAKHHRLVFGLFFDCLSTRREKKLDSNCKKVKCLFSSVFSFCFRRWKNKTAKTRNCLTKFSNYLDSERCRPCCPDGACQKRFSWFSDWSQKVQKFANIVDLLKSFLTSIYLRKSASIQPRTGLSKFAKH